jgi:hypothetical protein
MGKGGPGSADTSMVAVVQAQDKNLAHQIDEQKTNMNELLSTLEGRNNKRSAFPDLWPTEGGVVSSAYGGRTGPIEGGYDWHPGVDIAADFGAPIYASAMGTVEVAGWNGGYGRYVKINHGNGYESAYGHMSGIAVTGTGSAQRRDHRLCGQQRLQYRSACPFRSFGGWPDHRPHVYAEPGQNHE